MFTTFIGYEGTVNFSNADEDYHLHRNVIFRGNTAPLPFSSIDSDKPEDLWAYLENARKHGHEALAIPHNPNVSNGLVFDWVGSEGRPINQACTETRAANEPLIEIVQHKGTSEVHPALSPNDEFADFKLLKIGQLQGREPQSCNLLFCKAKHEIGWEAFDKFNGRDLRVSAARHDGSPCLGGSTPV